VTIVQFIVMRRWENSRIMAVFRCRLKTCNDGNDVTYDRQSVTDASSSNLESAVQTRVGVIISRSTSLDSHECAVKSRPWVKRKSDVFGSLL